MVAAAVGGDLVNELEYRREAGGGAWPVWWVVVMGVLVVAWGVYGV